MKAITIARQVGSWGDYIGVDVAKRLNMRYMDREIIVEAAQRAGISEASLESLEEQRGVIQRLMHAIMKTSLVPAIPSQALRDSEIYSLVAKDDRVQGLMKNGFSYAEAARHVLAMRFPEARRGIDHIDLIRGVVKEFAGKGDVVLAGSGSQMLLRDTPGVLHVLIVAPTENRIKAIMEQEGVSRKVAEKRVKENDEARSVYHRSHYKADWLDSELYDLVVNTGRVPYQIGADLIVQLFQKMS
jgi:cytidylate kinase